MRYQYAYGAIGGAVEDDDTMSFSTADNMRDDILLTIDDAIEWWQLPADCIADLTNARRDIVCAADADILSGVAIAFGSKIMTWTKLEQ